MRYVALLVLLAFALPAPADELWITQGQLMNGHAQDPVRLVDVHVIDGKITEITPAVNGRPGTNLHGAFLLPGLIDAHSHIEDPASAKRALLAGVTTTRVLGDAYLKGLATRDLIRQHHILGPDMLASGGHVRPRLGEAFILSFPQFGQYYDAPLTGPDNVAAVVRAVIERGADVIKVGASERAGLSSTDPRRQELSYEELRAAVNEAKAHGLFVAAHAHDRHGANAAVRAGVRSIEHGTWLDDETLALMKRQGTFFVPTLAVMSPMGDPRGDSAEAILLQVRTQGMMRPLREAVRKAHKLGIPVALGTDGTYGDGDDTARIRPAHEIQELIACGYTPLEAIEAGTVTAARLLGVEQRTGSVAVGLEADLLVVDRDPRVDPTTMFEPMLIVTNGAVVLDRLSER